MCSNSRDGNNVALSLPSAQLVLAFGSEDALQGGRSFCKCGLCVDKSVRFFFFLRFGDLESSSLPEEAS